MQGVGNMLAVFLVVVSIAIHKCLRISFSAIYILVLHSRNSLLFFTNHADQDECIAVDIS